MNTTTTKDTTQQVFGSYDWVLEMEADYKTVKGFDNKDLITLRDLYEFVKVRSSEHGYYDHAKLYRSDLCNAS